MCQTSFCYMTMTPPRAEYVTHGLIAVSSCRRGNGHTCGTPEHHRSFLCPQHMPPLPRHFILEISCSIKVMDSDLCSGNDFHILISSVWGRCAPAENLLMSTRHMDRGCTTGLGTISAPSCGPCEEPRAEIVPWDRQDAKTEETGNAPQPPPPPQGVTKGTVPHGDPISALHFRPALALTRQSSAAALP